MKLRDKHAGAGYAVGAFQVVCNVVLLALSSILLVDATNNPFLYFRF